MDKFFEKLPFKGWAEKIPVTARGKVPLLNTLIPWANQIACGLITLVVFLLIINAGNSSAQESSATNKNKSSTKESPASDFSYDGDSDGVVIIRYTGKSDSVVIPAKIEGYPVRWIAGAFAFNGFAGNDTITSIVIPDSVKEIGEYAFAGMGALNKITLSNGLEIIPEGTFQNSSKLTSVNLPSGLKEIHAWAFRGCGELNELIIPGSLTGIKWMYGTIENDGNGAFLGCQKLPIKTRQMIQNLGYAPGGGGF
jgi:hypothetical protein